MADNVCHPFYETSDVTFTATAAVTGKTFIAPSANRESGPGLSATPEGSNYKMATCGAGDKPFGVARYDVAKDAKGGAIGTPGRIVPVTTGGAIAAGDEVEVGSAGKAIKLASGIAVGLCVSGAASGAEAEVKLY